LFLTNFAKKVKIVHRSDKYRASQILLNKAKENPQIEFNDWSVIKEIKGEHALESVVVENTLNGEIYEEKTDGIFIAIGHNPANQIFPQIEIDKEGYIITHAKTTQTNIPGI